jgi:hypothetical protein
MVLASASACRDVEGGAVIRHLFVSQAGLAAWRYVADGSANRSISRTSRSGTVYSFTLGKGVLAMKIVQSNSDTALAAAFVVLVGLVILFCIGIVSTAILLMGG